jgi:hypothetical protein
VPKSLKIAKIIQTDEKPYEFMQCILTISKPMRSCLMGKLLCAFIANQAPRLTMYPRELAPRKFDSRLNACPPIRDIVLCILHGIRHLDHFNI